MSRYPPRGRRRHSKSSSHHKGHSSYLEEAKYRPKPAVIPLDSPRERTDPAKEEVHRVLRKVKIKIKNLQEKQEKIQEKQKKIQETQKSLLLHKRSLELSSSGEDPYRVWFNLNMKERIVSIRVVSWGVTSGQIQVTLNPEEEEETFSSTLRSTSTSLFSIDRFHPSISSWEKDRIVEVQASGRNIYHLSLEIEKIPYPGRGIEGSSTPSERKSEILVLTEEKTEGPSTSLERKSESAIPSSGTIEGSSVPPERKSEIPVLTEEKTEGSSVPPERKPEPPALSSGWIEFRFK